MSINKQTLEQMRASNPTSSVWMGASAGTGKTFVLTSRVLRLMLAGTAADKILCLTFTKAAATEMQSRINDRLAKWVLLNEADLFAELSALMGIKPTADQINLARKLFAKVLDVPGGLKIQTIHAFCQSLLGRFPIEASIAPHFQVMDERTSSEYLRNAQDDVFLNVQKGENKELSLALAHITQMETENTFADLMNELNGERSDIEQLKSRYLDISRVILSMRKLLNLSENDSRLSILELASSDGQFNVSGLKNAAEILLSGKKSDEKRGKIIGEWLADKENRIANFDDYKSAYLTTKGEMFKRYMTNDLQAAHPDALNVIMEEVDRILYIEERLKLISLLENSEALLHIGLSLIGAYTDHKKRQSVLDYDDLILKVRHLFAKENIANWILFKLDGGIDHILIDEAQDTNPDQWKVVRTLADEFFSGFGTHDEEDQHLKPRTIFAVGDVKQSIYSFQKANPQEFVENEVYFKQKAAHADLMFDKVPMNLSFRSTSAVLRVVDEVFKSQISCQAISFSEDEIHHDTNRIGAAGLVELWETECPKIEEEPEDNWTAPIRQKASHVPSMRVAENIAEQINLWIKNKEKLISQDRAITPGDILILVRHRNIFIQYMMLALKKRGINVAGLDRMVLTEQLAVMDLIAVAKFTLLPSDDLNLAIVLKSPFIGFSEDDLFDLAQPRKKGQILWSALLKRRNERKTFTQAVNILTALTEYGDFSPPFEFFSYLLGPLRGREKILARLGAQAGDPMDEFLSLAMAFENNNISSMQGFLNWVEAGDKEIKRDMEQGGDMVRIMTVHGSKGLQAPIVFLPDSCRAPKVRKKLFWADKHLFWLKNKDAAPSLLKQAYDKNVNNTQDEYKRLLYVAMTRAEDRLYITGWEGKNGRSDDCWYDQIRAALVNMEDCLEIKEGDKTILRHAQQQTAKIQKKELRSAAEIKLKPLPVWAKTMPTAEPTPTKPLTPSRPTEDDAGRLSPLLAAQYNQIDHHKYHRGRLIHKLLEILPEINMSRRRDAALKYLSMDVHELSVEQRRIILSEVLSIIENPTLEALFGANSRAEVPIVGLVGDFSLSGQVDRLVILENEILIIDYKTNRPPPTGVSDIPKIYLRQMAGYKHVLQDIYAKHNIRSFLLWTDIGELMEIPEQMLNKIEF